MGYLATPSASKKSCCSGCAAGASKCGGGLGDDAGVATDPKILALRAQVNRFRGADAPAAFRYGEKIPASGPLDIELATAAVVLNERRAFDSKDSNLIDQAAKGGANPLGFVAANIDAITKTISIYGDLNGVPKAPGGGIFGSTTLLIVGAFAIGVFLLKSMPRKGS
jgi:hypothetical protein